MDILERICVELKCRFNDIEKNRNILRKERVYCGR